MPVSARLIVNQAALKTKRADAAAADRRLRQGERAMKLRRLSTRDRASTPSSARSRATTPRRTRRCRRRCARSSPTCASAATRRCARTRRSSTACLAAASSSSTRQSCVDAIPRRAGGCACARRTSASSAFHERQLQKSWDFTDADGTRLGQQVSPLERVGLVRARRQGRLPVVGADERGAGEGGGRARAGDGEPESRTRWCSPRRRSPASTACSASAARRRSPRSPTARKSIAARRQDRRPGQRLCRRGQAPGVRRGRHRHGRRPLRDPGDRRRQRAGRLGGDGPVLAGRARRVGAGDPAFARRGLSGSRWQRAIGKLLAGDAEKRKSSRRR